MNQNNPAAWSPMEARLTKLLTNTELRWPSDSYWENVYTESLSTSHVLTPYHTF